AHAIAAFAYRTPVPIFDANVKRILYRYFGKKQASETVLWDYAYELFDAEHPFAYNQAMMDLGALVCRARDAACSICPLEAQCYASKRHPLAYPQKKPKKSIPIRQKDIMVFTCNNTFALKQRTNRFLKGLWGFIEYDKNTCTKGKKLGSLVQKYSHFHLHADVYVHHEHIEGYDYFTLEEIQQLPLSQADIKIVAMLC
ncbi:MAG: A/G-specific adenine glycosylase, partial [Sulfurimonas sp.]